MIVADFRYTTKSKDILNIGHFLSLLIHIFAVKNHKNMKYNILIITFLLLVAIFNATIGIGSLPLWAYILIEFISIILLVNVSVKMFSDNNWIIDQELKNLTETISTNDIDNRFRGGKR